MVENFEEEIRQMDEREFEKKHEIGKAVSIEDPIYTLERQKMVKVVRGTPVANAIKLFQTEGVACVLVTENEKLVGIFTERDVIRKLVGKGLDHTRELVDDYMTEDPEVLHLNDSIAFALNRMYDGGFRHVPIVDENNRPVGIVGVLDIVSHLAVYYSDKVLNLPPTPFRQPQQRAEGG